MAMSIQSRMNKLQAHLLDSTYALSYGILRIQSRMNGRGQLTGDADASAAFTTRLKNSPEIIPQSQSMCRNDM
jgi:hypothetical protein